jgi:hypothetical protein
MQINTMTNRQALQAWATDRTKHVIEHEQSHLAGLGPIKGTMHLDYQEVDGIRFAGGGHVSFKMPQLDTSSPEAIERSKVLFGYVQAGATGPGDDMSDQDKKVATEAIAGLAQANHAERVWGQMATKFGQAGLTPPKQLPPGYQLNLSA